MRRAFIVALIFMAVVNTLRAQPAAAKQRRKAFRMVTEVLELPGTGAPQHFHSFRQPGGRCGGLDP